jgi:beta-N-acetylhexosaminidase
MGYIMLCEILFALSSINPLLSMPSANSMSIEEKVGQVMVVHFGGEAVNDAAKTVVQDLHVGGIIYYNWSNGLNSPKQVADLSDSLQALAQQNRLPIPLLISTDQEGGIVQRLGFPVFPGNKALGIIGDSILAKQSAYAMGETLLSCGINCTYAPVLDIVQEESKSPIGIRSFGGTAEQVASLGQAMINGFRKAGVLTCSKHLPGLGRPEKDSHDDLPIIDRTVEELLEWELIPFRKTNADIMMTAHVMVPPLDPKRCVTLSPKTVQFLRENIGFKGPIITDSLVMQGVLKNCGGSIEKVAIEALKSCDILLLGGRHLSEEAKLELTVDDLKKIHTALVHAVQSGEIPESRLDEAVERILTLKRRMNFTIPGPATIDRENHQKLAGEIASQALKTTQQKPIPPLRSSRVLVVAPEILREAVFQSSILDLAKKTDTSFFQSLNPTNQEVSLAQDTDLLIIYSYNAWKNPLQRTLIENLLKTGKHVILVCTRDPLDATLFETPSMTMLTYSPTLSSLKSVYNYLKTNHL